MNHLAPISGENPEEAELLREIHTLRGQVHFLQAELKNATKQLEQQRLEFNAFARSISHDLKAPLRAAEGFSRALLEDYSTALDEHGLDYLRRVATSTHLMTVLLDQIVSLGRVSTAELRPESLDLTSMAHAIASDLNVKSGKGRVNFVISPHLELQADRQLVGILLQKLLSNAVKFSSRSSSPQVMLTAMEPLAGEKGFVVSDNGAGFESSLEGKLFQPFQRLHPPAEFPDGSGMGLVIAKKIMERHQGRIWAESSPGQGARFYFTFPIHSDDEPES